ncbi:cation-translocating P-type ATPase [Ornithinibacillus gellani]|uniref:cation-translocating P-type ATPase n=1 Tax=Ornithinibacillus gellani TaxID=2293253 RepID=UPI000F49CBB9|nr:cation-translocating P-type ATPase [Ornithinibacillus gellani]TQS71024.1 cation-translocating P-type ATPase [Ornithinibacillus gellani]
MAVDEEKHVHPETGLSNDEAKKRLEANGPNRFEEGKKASLLELVWGQINSLLIYILIAAAVISAAVGEVSDAVIIFFVILLNAVIGVIQEAKAEKALDELKKLSTPHAIVMRDGQAQEISSEEVVVGDIVLLDAGRFVPADIQLIESSNLKIEESSLTGESIAVEKDANWLAEGEDIPLGDQRNMAFMSTLVSHGRGTGVVTRTGMDTEIGKIAKMLANKDKEMTPLQKKLDEVGKVLGIGAIAISLAIFLIGFLQGREVLEMFLIAVSLAVAAIPEGLPAIVTIVLAVGVQRMIKQHAIIRKLPAVETLGAVSVICSDKTGTLTQNKMTVTELYSNGTAVKTADFVINQSTNEKLIKAIVLCNDATIDGDKQTGDPTEIALVEAGIQLGITKRAVEKEFPRVDENPFDSERKMMSTIHAAGDERIVYVKGALESILPQLNRVETDGEVHSLTAADQEKIMAQANHMSERALRVLAVAYKLVTADSEAETELIFLGLTGMIDPPREEVKDSIAACQDAGIQVVMITGDHQRTALAIAKELHIANHLDETLTGQELNTMSDTRLKESVQKIRVFARVSPEHKVRIVQALKSHGNIVSMTGDGVNDAPSLKEADVGVAMGITGTDVAKGAADVVLTDDNFSTIAKAVEEGRNIYKNIKKSILFLLSCNLGELAALFIGILMGWPAPLTAVHILWVNLITDTMPAISLGLDPDDPDVMKEKPRDASEKIFTKENITFSLWNGLLIGALTLFAFMEGLKVYTDSSSLFAMDLQHISDETLTHAQTMAFITLSVSQLFHSFNLRSDTKSIFQVGLFSNRYLIGAVVAGLLIQFTIVQVPLFSGLFDIHALVWQDWLFVLGLSIIPIIINELVKAGKRIFAA